MKAATVAALIIGIFLGVVTTDDPEVRYKVITKTETKTEIVTEEVVTVPDACIEAAEYANEIVKAAEELDLSSAELLDIMSMTRKGIAESDTNAMNDLETQLRGLNSDTVGAVQTIGNFLEPFHEASEECENAS